MAKQESKDPQTANVASDMQGNFTLGGGALSLSNLHYKVPGALIKLDGTYTLDGNKFDFYGTANLDASVSRLVGGWKGGWSGKAAPREPGAAPPPLAPPPVNPSQQQHYFGDALVKKFAPDVPISVLGRREEHFRGGTGETWDWPQILPMWWSYRNPVSGRLPENFLPDCVPCDYDPELSMTRHGYLLPPTGPEPNQGGRR